MAVQFGKSGCSSITVEPFTPICSFEAPAGTTPLTFDVPAVSIAMPVPPAECQCFDFTSEATTTDVGVAGCGEPGKASFDVEVVKADDDCCTGRYKVKTKGSVSVPCMPFTVSDPLVNVHSKSGSTATADMDGKVGEFYVRKGTGTSCCSLESGIDITFPDCRKGYDSNAVPLAQITYCDGNDTKSHQFITLKQDTDNCTLYPEVHPLTLPCCTLGDKTAKFTFSVNGTQYTGSLERYDCDYSITMPDITVNVPGVVIPDIPCFDTTTTYLKYKYSTDTTESGTAETTDGDDFSAEVKFSVVQDANKCYKLEVGTLDLSKIKGGMDIVSGGHVYPVTDSGTEETKLYVDGSLDDSARMWFAGGIGNASTDDVTKLQGLGLERGAVWPKTFSTQSGDDFVPYDSGHTHYISDGSITATAWRSDREEEKDNDSTTTLKSTGYATGTLVATVPTGFEWHERGVGIRIGEFVYNNAGVLSTYGEYYCDKGKIDYDTGWCSSGSGTDVIVAPGVSTVTYSGSSKNASGLVVYPTKQASTTFRTTQMAEDVSSLTSGLSVYPGKGVRIHGVTGMKPDSTKYGYKDTDANDSLTPGDLGKLEVNVRNDDLAFTSDGRLGFNDKTPDKSLKSGDKSVDANGLYYDADAKLHTLAYVRGNGADYTIPLIACPYVSTDWVTSGGFYNCDDLSTIPDAHLVYLHVSASGLILGIDNEPDCSKVTRRIT